MTAMDVFLSYQRRGRRIASLSEKIRRREAVATGATSRPSPAGGRTSTDESMRLLDYVGSVEALRQELTKQSQAMEEDKVCAAYLTELLPGPLGGVMMRAHIEGMALKDIAREMGFSVSYVKRLKRTAEETCEKIAILSWDRRHVPAVSLPRDMPTPTQ